MTQIYDPNNGILKVAAAMSGSGTNIVRLRELEQRLKEEGSPAFEIAAIFTDTPDDEKCNARLLAGRYDVPYFASDIDQFYGERGLERKKVPFAQKLDLLEEYYQPIREFLEKGGIKCIAYGGYMNIVSEPLLSGFININVHPADLRVLYENGRRKYTGDAAVKKAILAGEKYVHASTHLMTAELDGGPVVLVSDGLEVDLLGQTLSYVRSDRDYATKVADHNQNELKKIGDWVIFPQTIKLLSEGRLYLENGEVLIK